ncbi:MAG TPA: universal stress protein [Casimicrobiaceae bacterium]|nr:universal stress protein [Casimicrobiaceae bacterium]
MFRRILVPIDGSPTSNRGLEEAIALAKDQTARLCLVHIVDELVITQGFDGTMYVPPSYVDSFVKALSERGRKLLAKAEAQARKGHVKAETVLLKTAGQRVADVIIKQAKKWRADVIVLGTHGRRGLSRVLMGSDAEVVVREATVPVLLVRSPAGKQRSRRR